ncbi:MAG TPA: AgmX/PglI C-terminal domain-containing protein [Polyangia bacterium]
MLPKTISWKRNRFRWFSGKRRTRARGSRPLQSSTVENVRVEGCVVQAVRRWEFPRPVGGGIVIVSYPFNFTAGGAGD